MIALLALQIVAVALWGVETRKRALEEVGSDTPTSPPAGRRATV